MIAVVILGILEIALDCKPAGSLRCDKWFMDNKSVVQMVSTVLQLSNVYGGVLEENFYELIGSFVVSLLVSIDSAILIWAKWPIANDLQIIFMCIVSVVYQIAVLAMAMPLYNVYNRRMHRKIGSDPKTQRTYKHHLLTLTLLKFDVCLSLITIICAGEGIFNVEAGSVGVGRFVAALFSALICAVWAFLGWYAIRKERRVPMWLFFAGFIMAPIYCTVWYIFSPYHGNTIGKRYLATSFVVYATLTLCLHIALLIASIIRYQHFGLGLLDTIKAESTRLDREGRADEGFADLDSDEEFDLDISLEPNQNLDYQRMRDL